MIALPWLAEFLGSVTETIFEKIAPTLAMKSLSERVESEELAYNLIVTGLIYIPTLIIVAGAVWYKVYLWAFGGLIILICVVIWCANYARKEMQYQREREQDA